MKLHELTKSFIQGIRSMMSYFTSSVSSEQQSIDPKRTNEQTYKQMTKLSSPNLTSKAAFQMEPEAIEGRVPEFQRGGLDPCPENS